MFAEINKNIYEFLKSNENIHKQEDGLGETRLFRLIKLHQ